MLRKNFLTMQETTLAHNQPSGKRRNFPSRQNCRNSTQLRRTLAEYPAFPLSLKGTRPSANIRSQRFHDTIVTLSVSVTKLTLGSAVCEQGHQKWDIIHVVYVRPNVFYPFGEFSLFQTKNMSETTDVDKSPRDSRMY